MDSSEILEGNEECSSNESGWTTYIASPIHDDDEDDNNNEDDNYRLNFDKKRVGIEEDGVGIGGDSDDSMASDASSGPSHQGNVHGNHCMYGYGRETDNSRRFTEKKQVEKKLHDEQMKAGKDKSGRKANSGVGYSRSKVKKM